jgi:UPF0755 protein
MKPKTLLNRWLRGLMALVLVLALGAGFAAWGAWRWYSESPVGLKTSAAGQPLRVRIEKGMGAQQAMQALSRQGVQRNSGLLQLAIRLRGDANRIQSGLYELAEPLTVRDLLDKLVRGDVLKVELRILEGWTWSQARAAVRAQGELAQDTRDWSDTQLARQLGIEGAPEGWLFPSTYSFAPGSSDLEVYRQAYQLQVKRLNQAWEARAADVPLRTPYQLLVLASIVEKETGLESDRGKVAAVFLNRLRIGMMLQSDPTTIYGMGERFKGNLRRADLQTDTPFNTYTRAGLPPTPIALPGTASLQAIIQAPATKHLYFVARGDGSSEFSETLSQHNQAVTRFQLRPRPAAKSP